MCQLSALQVPLICVHVCGVQIPVVPYGGATSLEGHLLAPGGGVSLDFQNMQSVSARRQSRNHLRRCIYAVHRQSLAERYAVLDVHERRFFRTLQCTYGMDATVHVTCCAASVFIDEAFAVQLLLLPALLTYTLYLVFGRPTVYRHLLYARES